MVQIHSADQITAENIHELSETDVYELMDQVIRPLSPAARSEYMNLIRSDFDIRSISPSKKNLKKDMIMFGFKFFTIPNSSDRIIGIKKKQSQTLS